MRTSAFAAILALSACSGGGAEGNNQAAPAANAVAAPSNVTVPEPGGPADLASARATIERIYAAYRTDTGPDLDSLFTTELNAAIAANSEMEDGGLAYDPFCQCQDFENLTHRIESVDADGDNDVVARVTVTNAGTPHRLTIRLARRGAEWKVADIHDGERGLLTPR
jgi:lipoprotein-anchoring transpeptidase ErfK/SrfK